MSDINRRGLMLVLSSPSGAGKTTLSQELLKQDHQLEISISYTTRRPRQGEIHGKDYFFVSDEEFKDMMFRNEFLEDAIVFDNHYGTRRKFVEDALGVGSDILFDIDWQGTQQLKQTARSDVVSIFVLPPSWAELENRLHKRAQDSVEIIRYRMSRAQDEIQHWAEYDYILVNEDVSHTVKRIRHILESERLRRERQIGLPEFVRQLTPS